MKCKKILAALLAATVVSSAVPCFAVSANAETVAGISSSDFTLVESDSESESSAKTQDDALPSSLDLRDRGVVTPVKNQYPFGSCWAFAAIAASETSILSESGKTYAETGLDLSEKHLIWFAYNALEDSSSSQNGEGMHYIESTSSSAVMDIGGFPSLATSLFSQGAGPVNEKDYPYRGKNGIIQYRFDRSKKLVPSHYSADDDWSIDESERFRSVYALEESIVLPSSAVTEYVTSDDGSITKEFINYDETAIENVKKQLNQGRGVCVTYYSDINTADNDADYDYTSKENWCQYVDEALSADHAACIIGYDDNYPKENFKTEHQPEKNGAYLVKNSFGSKAEGFPQYNGMDTGITDENGDNTGYFWLSYYDRSITGFTAFDFDTDSSSAADSVIDQYDYLPVTGTLRYEANYDCSTANVFTASQHQELKEVSCMTSTANETVYYDVYLIDDKNSETLVSSKKAVYEYVGYHREALTNSVELHKGQKYKIVVRNVTEDGKDEVVLPYCVNQNRNICISNNTNTYSTVVVNKGESYLYYDGKWYDWTQVKKIFDVGYSDLDNFPIKGYSKPLAEETATVTVKNNLTYNGKMQAPSVVVKDYRGSTIPASDYTVGTHKDAGTYKVSITFKNDKYKYLKVKTASYKINKAATTISKGTTSKTFKSNIFGVTAKAKSFNINAKATRLGNKSSVSYTKVSGSKKITVSRAGKVTVAKGTKDGTYKVKVKLSKAATANFKGASKTVTLTIKVK